jgi:hypothetical protein
MVASSCEYSHDETMLPECCPVLPEWRSKRGYLATPGVDLHA